ncbi:hypothetical protein THAOC_37408 [Thalassiosira oceanica]|uniref:HSF-type DNA-binding domain-containing protein n=1 Tax=Thalassiosira oceanica TaxID=159749 RepID=K0QYE3_THAOC|nr:hypothetical protein THAOC_37408 [Thalassiosira oceanica]|eukprot:EJK44083.1 hypothetical protein THAOC_37408 [Thalassiosira oceanica]
MDYSGEEYARPSSQPRRLARRVSLCSSSTVDASRGPDRSTFPFKLYELLEYASNHGLASIVWTHDGEAFEIIDADALMDDVAPLFFKQTKFRSFTRQLNLWGFNRVEDSKRGWWHDNFIRGNVDRIALIKRIEVKGKSTTGKRSRRAARTSEKPYSSATAPDLAAAVGSVSESEVSSISSNTAEPPLKVLRANMSSSTISSETTHETTRQSQQQLRTSGLPSVPSQVWYNPAYIQSTPAFLVQAPAPKPKPAPLVQPAPLIRSIDPISTIPSMIFGGSSSNDSTPFAQMAEVEEEDAFDVAIRELFS